ncbi:MAG: hypothetical protein O9284_11815 [Steroidobacteraceae bacterium]|jgi:hypothetical protein|nr:hypothetical protein [Steroidobacteraceae bacterium]
MPAPRYPRAFQAALALVAATTVFLLLTAHTGGRIYDLASIALARRLALAGELAPPHPGTEPLAFADFHVRPAGPAGLEFTPRLRALDGRRVRLVGYVVGQDTPSPGRFIVAPVPVTLATRADGPADDLPPAHAYVQLPPAYARHDLPPLPVPVVLEGRLELGPRDEAHGRVSWVRLELDPDDPRLPRPAPENSR